MERSLVSVIIPTFNRAYCLPAAVDSALNQSHPDVEVIIIDDGSTDDTAHVIEQRYAQDRRVRYFSQANTGISGARNAGLARVEGDFVALLDSDDQWAPWKLELQVACMRAHPEVGMTWTDMLAVDPDDQVLSTAYLRKMYSAYRWFPTSESLFSASRPLDRITPRAFEVAQGRKFHYGDISSQMLMGSLVHTSTVVLTRARAELVKGFREDLLVAGEDYDFHLRTCRMGLVGFLDVTSIRYRRGLADHAASSANGIHVARNFLRTIKPIFDQERDRIALSPAMQQAVLAEAHAWLGEEQLAHGDVSGARASFVHSLLEKPRQPRALMMLSLACLPLSVRTRLYSAYRGLRAMRR